ncbi:MAG: hypothetical protein V3T81_04600, partial [Thermoanaerobaculia bacterium]
MQASFDEQEIQAIIRRVRERVGGPEAAAPRRAPSRPRKEALGEGIFSSIEGAVEAAWEAFQSFSEM